MRRILIVLVLLTACSALLVALWIFRGREISSFVDRYWTIETASAAISSVEYQGSGTGGILMINGVSLSLNDVSPGVSLSVGSTKDNQLALASSGKVFPFGPLTSDAENTGDRLTTVRPAGDQAFLATRHSVLNWPSQIDFNFMTGQSPSWKRHIYNEVRWKKSSGQTLKMLWRYEQFFYRGKGWAGGTMTRENSSGLVLLQIKE